MISFSLSKDAIEISTPSWWILRGTDKYTASPCPFKLRFVMHFQISISFYRLSIFFQKPIFFRYYSDKVLNAVYQLFDNNGNVKFWSSIKEEFGFNSIFNFKWQQLIYALPPLWKTNNKGNRPCWQSITPKSPHF